jgi:antagonist of KipI
MDLFAYTCANILTGNDPSAAALEMTVIGPKLSFEQDALVAICGADMKPTIQGEPVPMWRPVYIKAGAMLEFQSASHGIRAYLAVSGGIHVEQRMGSRSTYLRAGIGGYEGRALAEGDQLTWGRSTSVSMAIRRSLLEWDGELQHADQDWSGGSYIAARWSISPWVLPRYEEHAQVRFLPGPHHGMFREESLTDLEHGTYQVGAQSDRMGYRLEGKRLMLRERQELYSEPVTAGSVQVPPDGRPIILMADRQTTGGYPVIAQIISVDLPLVAQIPPGGRLSFVRVDIREAQRLLLEERRLLAAISASVRMRVQHA